MLRAYIDESGCDGRSDIFVLAGYLARFEDWELFTDEWQAALDLIPQIKPAFKMNDAHRLIYRDSVFYGWTERQRDDRLELLADIIDRHAMYGFISAIPIAPYREAFAGRFKMKALDRPYFLAFFGVTGLLHRFIDQSKINDRVDLIFDTKGDVSKALLMEQYETFIALAPPELRDTIGGPPSFGVDEEVRPLQAADMIAWNARKYHNELTPTRSAELFSDPLMARLMRKPHAIDIWSKERIISAANAAGPDLRRPAFIEVPMQLKITFSYNNEEL